MSDTNISIEERIKSFASLPNGWDYGVGDPASEATVTEALLVCSIGKLMGFGVGTNPRTDGGISLTFFLPKHDHYFVDVIISPKKKMEIVGEKGKGVKYKILFEKENLSMHDVIRNLNKFKHRVNQNYNFERVVKFVKKIFKRK